MFLHFLCKTVAIVIYLLYISDHEGPLLKSVQWFLVAHAVQTWTWHHSQTFLIHFCFISYHFPSLIPNPCFLPPCFSLTLFLVPSAHQALCRPELSHLLFSLPVVLVSAPLAALSPPSFSTRSFAWTSPSVCLSLLPGACYDLFVFSYLLYAFTSVIIKFFSVHF